MRTTLTFLALAIGLGAVATNAAEAAPAPLDCGQAYELITQLRSREREMNYQSEQDKSRLNFIGLGKYADGYESIDFDARARELEKRYPDDYKPFGVMGIAMDIHRDKVDGIMMESSTAKLNVLLSPGNIYQRQYPLFARVRECDVAYSFTPALGTPPALPQLVDMLKKAMDREREQHDAHIENLSDLQCAVRFGAAAQLSPAGSPTQNAMAERYNGGLAKVVPTFGDMPQERIKERIDGEMRDLASHLQSKSMSLSDLVEEVHACERRFGMPVSDLKAP